MQRNKRKRDWQTSPARPNEDHSVELPRVGQPLGSSRTSGAPEVGRCGYSVLVRDEVGQAQDGEISLDARADEYVGPGRRMSKGGDLLCFGKGGLMCRCGILRSTILTWM